MKKIAIILLIAALFTPLFASPSKEQAADNTDYSAMTLDQLKGAIKTVSSGTLTVATSPDFAPYEFYSIGDDGTPALAGFDMSLAKYIADYLGLKLEVIPMDFDGTLMEVQNKNVDLGIAGYSPDPSRAEIMEFSDIYYEGGQSFVTTKANAGKFKSLEDTNKKEYSIAAQVGSIQMDLAAKNSPNADIIALSKVTDIIAELITGKISGAYIETVVAKAYQKNYPDLELVLDVPYESEGSAIGVSKGNLALLEGVNRAIAQALSDGSMNAFVAEANEKATGNIIEGLLN
ncbi:MAG: transporter substrate-binding domain-containing protein [Sphaerochaetaceae bacterium]|nr:transporter substrate-binding domain-containing protein [Sphaerochaetaceae bacterium]